ncbi:MAG: hypothetical protein IPJ03_16600 [Ignavibacteriales bacterium]|nr:hypothetical protein [Ignavibacteriales bacterium]
MNHDEYEELEEQMRDEIISEDAKVFEQEWDPNHFEQYEDQDAEFPMTCEYCGEEPVKNYDEYATHVETCENWHSAFSLNEASTKDD